MGNTSFRSALNRMVTARRTTLGRLARRAGYSRGFLWELSTGRKSPAFTTVEDLDAALEAAGTLVAAWTADEDVPDRDVRRNAAQRGSLEALADRTAVSLLEVLAVTADESAKFIRRAGVGVSAEYVAQLAAEVETLAVDFLQRPPYAVYRRVGVLRREVLGLLDTYASSTYATDLYLAAGRLTAFLAHLSADLGQPVIAEAHTRAALMASDLAGGHQPLRSYVRWIQSNVAYWCGDHRSAATIAHDAQRDASGGTWLLRLASQEARSAAGAGDSSAAEDALRVAQEQREQLGGQTEPGVLWFAPGKAAYYAAEARLALGGRDNARQAVADAIDAAERLSGEESPSPELVAAAQLDLASAHLADRQFDEASAVLNVVLDLPAERRTAPITDRAVTINAVLAKAPYAGGTVVDALRERISIFIAYPAARGLATEME